MSTITFKGKTGISYTFNIYRLPITFQSRGGVYLFTKEVNITLHSCVYLGITGNLNERFDSHHKAVDIERNGATHICVIFEEDKSRREFIERDLLNNIETDCNDKLN